MDRELFHSLLKFKLENNIQRKKVFDRRSGELLDLAYFGNVRSVDAVVSGRQFGRFVVAGAAVFVAAATTAVSARVWVAVWVAVLGASTWTASGNTVRILIRNRDARSVADVWALYRRHFRFEHIHRHDVDDHHLKFKHTQVIMWKNCNMGPLFMIDSELVISFCCCYSTMNSSERVLPSKDSWGVRNRS